MSDLVKESNFESTQVVTNSFDSIFLSISFDVRLSGNSILFISGHHRIRLRHDTLRSDYLYCSTNIDGRKGLISIAKADIISILTTHNRLSLSHWSTWSNFDKLPHTSSLSSLKPVAQSVIEEISQILNDHDKNTSIDLVLSGQSNSRICFIFNKGFSSCPVQTYFTNGFLSDISIIEMCKRAEIVDIVFWDGITSDKKVLPIKNMLLMLHA